MKKTTAVILSFIVYSALGPYPEPAFAEKARSVILLIGDGMGPAIIGIAKNYNDLVLKRPPLNLEKMMNEGRTGVMMTYSSSNLVTDSAAGATAFACGVKTYNEALGITADGKPVETVLEKAKKAGKSVGLVTTADLADATPAAFYAHVARRSQREDIVPQGITGRKVDVLLGGGTSYFNLSSATANGYRVLTDKSDMARYDNGASTFTVPLLGVFSPADMPYVQERATSTATPSLPDMTRLALEDLAKNRENGFFLMVEGGRIDHAGHANLAETMVREFLEFDEVIGLALDYQKKDPDTLILVTADHDTGGIALSKEGKGEDYPTVDELKDFKKIYWISHNHTGCPVYLIGKGPNEEKVNGLRDNTDVYRILMDAMELQ